MARELLNFDKVASAADLALSAGANLIADPPTAGRQGLIVSNNDASIHVRWGDSTVGAAKGARIPAGTQQFIGASDKCKVYVAPESGSPKISWNEVI